MSNAPLKPTNTQTIARNSVWFGLELFFSLVASFVTSILVARAIGPQRLGYFQYLVWLTNVTTVVGAVGLPLTTRKYMAECLNRGEEPVARAIYRTGLRLQTLVAALITLAGLVLVFLAGDPAQRVISVLLVLNIAPRIVGLIPSQGNNAAELMKRNTPPALIGGVLNVALTLVSLWVGWDLTGVAASVVLGAAVETGLKLYDVHRRLAPVAIGELSPELKKRMLSYSGQGLVLMLLNAVVWDRSDLLILKALNPDIKQVTFFSLAFNFTERVLMIPSAFMTSVGVTMMAQYGRGQERLHQLVLSGAKYTLLIALPLLTGMACLSHPMVALLYGDRYLPLVPVLTITALFAIPKALVSSPTSLLQTTENQGFLIWVGCACGALDILLDVLLTPGYGARGAAFANGVAQTAAAIAIWLRVRGLFRMDLRLGEFARIAVSAGAMAAVTLLITGLLWSYAGVALAFCAAVAVWFLALRFTRAVDKTDGERLLVMTKVLPGGFRTVFARFVNWLTNDSPLRHAA